MHRAMKVKASSSFIAPIYVIVIILALGFSFAVKAQAPAENDSPAELGKRIEELYQQGKYKEAIPLAEKLIVLTKRVKGDECSVARYSRKFSAESGLSLILSVC
jgi:hypothetical protein